MYRPRVPVTIIAAMNEQRVIGKEGRLPWHVPEDLEHFKGATMGRPLIVGRKTWESLPPLAGRLVLVVSDSLRQRDIPREQQETTEVYATLDGALQRAEVLATRLGVDEIMVAGGAQVYGQAMVVADRLLLTTVGVEVDGADAFFPQIDEQKFRPVSLRTFRPSVSGASYCIREWQRIPPAMFQHGELVKHAKTGTVYVIHTVPEDGLRLGSTGEPAYAYQAQALGPWPLIWVRGQAEMEDGRFVRVGNDG